MPYLSDLKAPLKTIDSSQSAFLITGSHRIRLELLEQQFLPTIGIDRTNSSLFFGDSLDEKGLSQILDELNTNDLFTPRRLIRIINGHNLKTGVVDTLLKSTLPEQPANVLLIHAHQLKSNSRLRKRFAENKALIELPELKENILSQWVTKHAESLGMPVTNEAAQLVVDIADGSPDTIDQTLQQLKLYCELDKAPTKADVLALFRHHPDPNEFQLLEQLLTCPPHEVDQSFEELISSGKNVFSLLNLMGKSASRLLLIRELLKQGTPEAKIPSVVGAPPWLVKKEMQLLRKTNFLQLRSFHKRLITADAQLKGKSLGTQAIFSQLVRG